MAFNPCLVIPVYNHHQKLSGLIPRLRQLKINCILIDDGSNEECHAALNSIDSNEPWIEYIRCDTNRGKGAVVCDALRHAAQRGHSHALQIDADGQHDLADIPKFIETAKQFPNAVICGARPYHAMPPNRRYGRIVTDVWVWINTLSTTIKDSMCGFRLYPLAESVLVIDRYRIGQRMDFDTDILVKLYWSGLELQHIETGVVYQDDIESHFDVLKDNIRISKMHAKHFFGMLLRAPCLIARKLKRSPHHA